MSPVYRYYTFQLMMRDEKIIYDGKEHRNVRMNQIRAEVIAESDGTLEGICKVMNKWEDGEHADAKQRIAEAVEQIKNDIAIQTDTGILKGK